MARIANIFYNQYAKELFPKKWHAYYFISNEDFSSASIIGLEWAPSLNFQKTVFPCGTSFVWEEGDAGGWSNVWPKQSLVADEFGL